MAWSAPDGWLTRLLSGDPLVILVAVLITFSLPVLMHVYFYTASETASLTPTFLLLGPSGAGKTSLLSLLQSASAEDPPSLSPTRVSQISSRSTTLTLPASIPLGSNKYRSENDDYSFVATRYNLRDTPGHGKLRLSQGLRYLSDPSLRGLIYMVDAASFEGADNTNARDTATYLHDVLLRLQKRGRVKQGKKKLRNDIPVLVAANKQDLFTALPPGAVRERLETDIERVRRSKSRGLVTVGTDETEDPEESLGGDGEERFTFKMLKYVYVIKL